MSWLIRLWSRIRGPVEFKLAFTNNMDGRIDIHATWDLDAEGRPVGIHVTVAPTAFAGLTEVEPESDDRFDDVRDVPVADWADRPVEPEEGLGRPDQSRSHSYTPGPAEWGLDGWDPRR